MRSRTLKHEALVFEGKVFRSRGDDGGVFEMNQDPLSSEQNDCREPQGDKARKQMRRLFRVRGTHGGVRSYCRHLTPQSNFTSLSRWLRRHCGSDFNDTSSNTVSSVFLSILAA